MKRLRTLLILASLLLAEFARAETPGPEPMRTVAELREKMAAHLMQPRFGPALWSVKVVSLETGAVVFEHHADRRMSPASNTKLYTGALALDLLGGDYRIVTPLLASTRPTADGTLAGDLIISGRGDPSWNHRREKKEFGTIFAPFIAALTKAGVRRITGDVVADATYFWSLPNGAGWTADDLTEEYGAEISAVSLADNYAELRALPGPQAGSPAEVTILQPHTGLVIDNRLVTSPVAGERRTQVARIFGEPVVHLFGALPVASKEALLEVAVPQPAAWFARALREELGRQGIRVDGSARAVRWPDAPPVPASAVVVGEITSPPLRDLVTGFMKPSQNLETDLIFAHLGEKFRAAGAPASRSTEESAVLLLRDFLRRHGLPADEVLFEEGSGLSRNNLTTANATAGLLRVMATHPAGADFFASLPIAGVDGTLARRLKGAPTEGKVRAKTGTLRYANALSGYLTTAAGERLAFSFLLNRNVAPAGRAARDDLDDLVIILASLAARSVAPAAN